MKTALFLILFALVFCGCADVKTPTAQYALTHPLSTKTMVVAGTSKDEVLERWGEPNNTIDMGFDDMGLKKEAWIYYPWFPEIPLDHKHLSRGKKIYFVGDHVTGYKDIEGEPGEEEK